MEESQIQPTPPVTSQQQPSAVQQSKNNKNLYVVFIVVLILAAGMVFYIITNNRNPVSNQAQNSSIPTQPPVVSPISTGSAEEKEVEQVDVIDTAPTDFPEVEKDVQGL